MYTYVCIYRYVRVCNRHVHLRVIGMCMCACMCVCVCFCLMLLHPALLRRYPGPSVDTFLSPYFFFQPPSCSLSHLNEELGLRF